MKKLMQLFPLCAVLTLAACSTRVSGPLTGREYDVNVGCTDDMKQYAKDREAAMQDKSMGTDEKASDCVPGDRSRDIRGNY